MTANQTENSYRDRVSRVVAAIVADPMAEHSLKELADLAHFSPFHFHRIYRSITGETIAATVRRVRLARAAQMLGSGNDSVTKIGMEVGYDSPQAFSRAFQQFTGVAPREFQKKMTLTCTKTFSSAGNNIGTDLPVQVIERASQRVQALRHRGPPSTIPHIFRRMHSYVGDRSTQAWYGIILGDPETGDGLTYHAAASGLGDQPIHEDVELMDIAGGCYALYILVGPYSQINAAMTSLFSTWLPTSPFEPDDRPALECYLNSPRDTAPENLLTELLIPIRPINP